MKIGREMVRKKTLLAVARTSFSQPELKYKSAIDIDPALDPNTVIYGTGGYTLGLQNHHLRTDLTRTSTEGAEDMNTTRIQPLQSSPWRMPTQS